MRPQDPPGRSPAERLRTARGPARMSGPPTPAMCASTPMASVTDPQNTRSRDRSQLLRSDTSWVFSDF
jgi:hypothetical protein